MHELRVMAFYLGMQILANYTTYRVIKTLGVKTRLGLFLASLTLGATATLTSLGPIGLILGGPSIVVAAISMSLVIPIGGVSCSNSTTKESS